MQEDRLNYHAAFHGLLSNESEAGKWALAFSMEEFVTVAKLMTASWKFLLLPEGLICCLLFVIYGIFKLRPGERIAGCI